MALAKAAADRSLQIPTCAAQQMGQSTHDRELVKGRRLHNKPIMSVIARRDDSRQCQLSYDILAKPGCRQISLVNASGGKYGTIQCVFTWHWMVKVQIKTASAG